MLKTTGWRCAETGGVGGAAGDVLGTGPRRRPRQGGSLHDDQRGRREPASRCSHATSKACSNSPSSTPRAATARAAGSAARGRSRWTPPATPSTWSTPASDTISVFDLSKKEPDLIQIVSSGGTFPNSVALSGNLLYVLNAGGAPAGSTPSPGSRSPPAANSPPWRIPRGRLSAAVGAPRPGQLFPGQPVARRDREERQ